MQHLDLIGPASGRKKAAAAAGFIERKGGKFSPQQLQQEATISIFITTPKATSIS